jgi:hypothetical protein
MAGAPFTLMHMTIDRDRVISVSLSEAEWQAFVERHPQPVNWLRHQILTELQDGRIAEGHEGNVRIAERNEGKGLKDGRADGHAAVGMVR